MRIAPGKRGAARGYRPAPVGAPAFATLRRGEPEATGTMGEAEDLVVAGRAIDFRPAASRLHRITAWQATALPGAIVLPPLRGSRLRFDSAGQAGKPNPFGCSGRYRLVERWTPAESSPVRRIGEVLLTFADWHVKELY